MVVAAAAVVVAAVVVATSVPTVVIEASGYEASERRFAGHGARTGQRVRR